MFDQSDIIDVYTRAEALEDGVLVDVTETAREAGFSLPVAVTAGIWASVVQPGDGMEGTGESEAGRLWDLLWVTLIAIRGCPEGVDRVTLTVLVGRAAGAKQLVTVRAICGPGDQAEPVITILLPGEE